MKIVHVELRQANEFVGKHHRHHKLVVGHRFSLGLINGEKLVGVAIIGRPVARKVDATMTVEVTRLCTDGTPNACSILYGAAARAAKALGYSKIQTYILDSELGTSLKAAGWIREGVTNGGQWIRPDGSPRRMDQPICPKQRWVKQFS